MNRLPTAAALAILLVTAGIAGVVSADPNGTDTRTNATAVQGTAPVDDGPVTAAVDRPVTDADFEARLAHRLARFDLTDGQVRVVVTEASRLRDDGASRLVVRSSVVMHLYEFGVDAPFLYADEPDRPGTHERFHRYLSALDATPAQARALHAMAHRMHEAGATRAEIQRAIHRQLADWDVDARSGDGRPDPVDRLVDRIADRHDLTDERAADIERLVRRMLADGAHRGEIRQAIDRQLAEWGVKAGVEPASERSTPIAAR